MTGTGSGAAPAGLTRSLGVVGVLLLTLSVATPASSVFVIIPGMLQEAGTGAIWATVAAALVCVATAYIYAELSSTWPVAGGEYVMVAQTLGPLAGFVMLGVNVFNNLIFLPVAGLGIRARCWAACCRGCRRCRPPSRWWARARWWGCSTSGSTRSSPVLSCCSRSWC